MRKKIITLCLWFLFVLFTVFSEASTIRVKKTESPKKNYYILYYDSEFLFVGRHFGSHKDPHSNTEPGFFVHSKKLDKWLLITDLSTEGAKLGKSYGFSNKEDVKKMMRCSVSWDFTNYRNKDFIALPLKTSGSIAFPEKIIFEQEKNKYLLVFFGSWKVKEAETVLEFKKNDLEVEFRKIYKP